MLKDIIMKSHNLLLKENDNIPLGMRGELEVIVRDKDDNIVSYQKDHNTITQWMKHAITHMLAGYVLQTERVGISGTAEPIYSTIQADHSTISNPDGMLISKKQYFTDLSGVDLNLVPGVGTLGTGFNSAIYPTKMLFGTGVEFPTYDTAKAYYGTTYQQMTGFDSEISVPFENNLKNDKNYFNENGTITDPSTLGTRTCQPLTTQAITENISSSSTGIKGAIKDCLINSNNDLDINYDAENSIVKGEYRGVGRPCFVYAERKLDNLFSSITEYPGYVKVGSEGTTSFENKITYSVVLPRTTGFYPYDGWILKEAGLFNDAPFLIGGADDVGDNSEKMLAGTLLAKRYISPVLKTQDNSIEFIWSIYINPA